MRTPARRSDFNGDGRSDLATLQLFDEEDTPAATATALITGGGGSVLCRQEVALVHRTETQDVTTADVNGDGRADLIDEVPGFGVDVYYGNRHGLRSPQRQTIRNPLGFPADFGWSVTPADFNHDGYPDLAIGAPQDSEPSGARSSRQDSILIYHGGPNGVRVKHPQRLRSPNHKSLFFGNNTYAGEFTGDHHPDLVEARQGYASGPKNGLVRKSRVVFMRGTSHGLAKPVKIASIGGTVLVGDVVGSHADDLLIQNDTGIHVLVGHKRGLTKPTLLPNTAGLGRIQGLMDVDRDGHLDALVLGTGPTVDGSPTAALQILPGTGNGFDVSAAWQIDASTPDAPACIAQGGLAQGSATQERVLTRDVTGDGLPDLLVGAEVNPATEDCPLPELDVFNGGPESLTTSATYYQFPSSDAWYHAV